MTILRNSLKFWIISIFYFKVVFSWILTYQKLTEHVFVQFPVSRQSAFLTVLLSHLTRNS